MLSLTTREGIKLAAALTLSYGIALAAGWEKPMWAALAVIIASQVNLGQSLTHGALRVMGTVLGVLAAWTLFMLFPQDRWIFMVSLSLWVGLCVYLMQASGRQYFWQVAAFTSLIIWFSAGADFSASFEKGIERAQETTLGVVVYSLIALLVWPVRSRRALDGATVDLMNAQQGLSAACLSCLYGEDTNSSLSKLQIAMLQADAKLDGALRDATIDSFEVWERRQQWEQYGRQASALTRALLRLSDSLESVAGLDVPALLPGLNEFATEIEGRLIASRKLLAEGRTVEVPDQMNLEVSPEALEALTAFQAAALSVTRKNLLAVETHTRELIASIRAIEECAGQNQVSSEANGGRWIDFLMPDPERMIRVARVMTGIWVAYLAYLYLPGLPGGEMPVMLVGSLCIALALLPPIPITIVCIYVVVAMLIAGFLYFFIVIDLTSFYGLALLIFGWTLLIYQSLSSPKLQPARVIVLIFTQMVIGIQNVQTYSFTSFLTLFMVCMIALLIVSMVENIPFSNRPERVFARQVRRFFNSSAYLTSLRSRSETEGWGWLTDWIQIYHRQVVKKTPRQLAESAKNVLFLQVPGVKKQQLLQMVNLVRLISDQILALNSTKNEPAAGTLPDELKHALNDWHAWGQNVLRGLAGASSAVPLRSGAGRERDLLSGRGEERAIEELRETKREALQGVEKAIQQSLHGDKDRLSILPGIALSLNTLDEARHLSDSLEQLADVMTQVDWERFLESRFAS